MRLKWDRMLEKVEVPKCPMAVNPLPLCKCQTCCKDLAEACSVIALTSHVCPLYRINDYGTEKASHSFKVTQPVGG